MFPGGVDVGEGVVDVGPMFLFFALHDLCPSVVACFPLRVYAWKVVA